MTLQEAIKVIKPGGNSAEDLTAAYRILAKKYHPDINPDGLELMKCVNAAVAMLREHINKWSIKSFVDDGAPSIDEGSRPYTLNCATYPGFILRFVAAGCGSLATPNQ